MTSNSQSYYIRQNGGYDKSLFLIKTVDISRYKMRKMKTNRKL